MTKNTEAEYAVSPLEAEPGESGLTPLELSYLRAAGIDPHLLNEMDRDDVIHLLVMHPDRVENPRIGDVAALIYNFGLLREMLEGDVDPDSDDDDSDDGDDDQNKNRKHKRKDVRAHEQELVRDYESMPAGEFSRCEKYKVPASYASEEYKRCRENNFDGLLKGLDTKGLGIAFDNDDGPVVPTKTPTAGGDDSVHAKAPCSEPETWVEKVAEEKQDTHSTGVAESQ